MNIQKKGTRSILEHKKLYKPFNNAYFRAYVKVVEGERGIACSNFVNFGKYCKYQLFLRLEPRDGEINTHVNCDKKYYIYCKTMRKGRFVWTGHRTEYFIKRTSEQNKSIAINLFKAGMTIESIQSILYKKTRTIQNYVKNVRNNMKEIKHIRCEIKPKLCKCGCKEMAKPGNRFIHGHHTRLRY